MGECDLKVNRLKDIAYDAQYLKKLQDLKAKSRFIRNSVSREKLKTISKKSLRAILNKCDQKLANQLSYKDTLSVQIALDEILYGKSKFTKRFNEALKILEIDDWTISPFLFYTAPSYFYLPSQGLIKYVKRSFNINPANHNYIQFNSLIRQKIKGDEIYDYFKEPIELEAAFETLAWNQETKPGTINPFDDSLDIKMINDIIEEVKKLDIYRLKEFEIRWIKDFYSTLEQNQKESLIETLRANSIHPYLRRLLTQKTLTGVVIDASNIMHSGLIEPDPLRLKELMNVLGINQIVYFPLLFVFDANADFIVQKKRDYWEKNFLNNPNVFFHSPADEYVLNIAFEKKYHVISNDKYRDYNADDVTLFQFRPDRGEFFLKKVH